METPHTPTSSIEMFRTHCQAIKSLGGEKWLRKTLSAERAVTAKDQQMSEADRAEVLAIVDQIEAELLPT